MKLKPRIVFDLCMAVILVICMQYGFTGGLWHEIAGTVLIVMFTVHIIMNRKYYGAVIKKMRSGNKKIVLKKPT